MKAADMRRVLGDFKYEKTKVEKYLCGRGPGPAGGTQNITPDNIVIIDSVAWKHY